ncbi:MAG: hypothetical protein HeimC3_05330 [Candidatus Heimdallarchaeota archaeon LC_3]|nr:MAG: hypothetical protein HeimC3_05330 [Candidatus Heimdallarchaeota archaeon LC_3]
MYQILFDHYLENIDIICHDLQKTRNKFFLKLYQLIDKFLNNNNNRMIR